MTVIAPSTTQDPFRAGRLKCGSMSSERLSILYVSQMPASPPRFGAQARVHGLMTQLGRRHELTAVMLVDHEFDIEECRRAMQAYCRDVVLVPNPNGHDGLSKRLLQLTDDHGLQEGCDTIPERILVRLKL